MSAQDCGDELSLHLEDGEFMEECQQVGNNSVKVSPMNTQKRPRQQDEDMQSKNKKYKQDQERQNSNHRGYDCMAKIDELLRPCGIANKSKGPSGFNSPSVDKCIVTLQGGREEGSRAYLHRSDLYIYGKRMSKADFIDVLNSTDRLFVKVTHHRQGFGAPKGKHAVIYDAVKAWIGNLPSEKDKESPLPKEGDADRKAFKDYLQAHNLTEAQFRNCYEGKRPKKPFFPVRKTIGNTCFVSSLLAPKGEGEGASCGVVEVAEGPLKGMVWGFDQTCLYICGVRIHCNDLNRLFLTADRVGTEDATYLTVEATWKQSSEEASFWDHRVGPAIKNHPSFKAEMQRPECKMMANMIYYGIRPTAPERFEPPPSVDDILNNAPLMKWLGSQKMEPQFFHDLLQGVLPPIKQVLAYNNTALINAQKLAGSNQHRPLPIQASKTPTPLMGSRATPLMGSRAMSPLTAATEHFLNSPKSRGNWPEGWTDEQDRHRSKGRTNAFDRLGPIPKSRNASPKSRRPSPVKHSNKSNRSPRRNPSPEISILSPTMPSSPKRMNAINSAPKVNLSGAVGSGSNSAHITGTLNRVERIVNGVLQCVSHDDPKVDSIITDKADLQMAMFISKTLTTAIIRFNTGASLQKQNLPSLTMGSLANSNVGVVKPLNMGGFGGQGTYGGQNAGFYNNQKAENLQQAWGLGKGMDIGNNHGGTGDDMTGFRAAASAAGFHIR